ncbi:MULTISPECIES: 1,2-dihydroxy-3-keto-5-methylthiopentene dioxygenase [Psychrobacillus]|uniref:1,2-dihydroxy-3-keto-5-methylthiopentene dioxygenase n=1 Tax=Psychrobacillus TaxID=1221880 RepID=UPI0008E38B0D|nr:cupin domain-containing protein [Psychrobacillus psychrodurans]MCZ8541017.1 cupin domain-containing protein [Psychrobacillus psychrodurans]SFM82797.1 1,2-dihydroxy-3-keto-5-methylthiopentene dioxygenase [Psychrobacillus psychrodurans]
MAIIKIQETSETIEAQNEVEAFLESQEVIYEHWDIDKLPENLREKFNLDDDEKQEILKAFKSEIDDISTRRGYQSADIISLSDSNPNLDELLKNFERKHLHTDDEVRYIVSGHGIFIIQGKDERYFEVHLSPGDLISVPENITHYFTLSEDRKVVAVRIFVTTEGWVPVYQDEVVEQ